MELNELIQLQDKLEQYLLPNYYSFIGPENQNLLSNFANRVNDMAPVVSFNRRPIDFLGNKNAVLLALPYLPVGTMLRIYVANSAHDNFLFHSTIEEYCNNNNITLT